MSKKHKKHRKLKIVLSYRTKIIIAVAFALIIVGTLIIILIMISRSENGTDADYSTDQIAKRDADVRQSQRDGAVLDRAEEAVEQGNTEKANEIYQQAIDAEESTERKVKLVIDQSRLYYYSGNIDEAIRVSIEAEKLGEDKFLIAFWLARLYEDQRQYRLAADNYTLAGKWADSPTNKANFDKSYFDTQANRVAGLAGS
jgi:tetratricopeptide (TPR) repeat protein